LPNSTEALVSFVVKLESTDKYHVNLFLAKVDLGGPSPKASGSYEAVKGLARPYKVAASIAQTARLAAP